MMLSMSHFVREFIDIDIHFIRKKPLNKTNALLVQEAVKSFWTAWLVLSAAHTPFQL